MAITRSMNAAILAIKHKYPQDLYTDIKVYVPKYNVLNLEVWINKDVMCL